MNEMRARNVIVGMNDLRTWCLNNNAVFLLEEWDKEKNEEMNPETISYASNKKVWWRCPEMHSYDAKVGNRTFLGRGCPYCSGSRTLEGFNDFGTWCIENGRKDLLDEWNYDKNVQSPSQILAHSNRKVWWKCSLSHEWECGIGGRTSKTRPSGCPYCSNPPKKVLLGFNDFKTWCESNGKDYLLKEWNVERNGDVLPTNITYGSGKKIWWKCIKGHEWCVSTSNRIRGTGCPVCTRRQTSFPEQAIAFYLSKSFNILQRYNIKGYEIDVFLENHAIGIEYDGMFYHSEATIEREQAKDSFYRKQGITLIRIKENKEKVGVEGDNIFFVPKKKNYLDEAFNVLLHSLISLIRKRTGVNVIDDIDVVRDELEIREHYASIIKKSSVADVFPDLVAQWDVEKNKGMMPDNFSANAHAKVWWRCVKGHSWQADISSRNRKLGCPYCAGQRVIGGVNDLESWCVENAPELLGEWNYEKNTVKISEIAKTSNKKVWWQCSKGHEWEAVIANRVHGTRCPYCFTGNNVISYTLSFAEWCKVNKQEELLIEWNYDKNSAVKPETVSKASHKKVWWKCAKGHEWEAQIKSRTYNHGCPYCSGTYKKVLVGKNDLVTWCKGNEKLYILNEWDYDSNGELTPDMFTFGSHKRINWKCSKGHKWSAVIKERTKFKGNMCMECKRELN